MEASKQMTLMEDVARSIDSFNTLFKEIPEDKRNRLNDLSIYISSKLKSKNKVKILLTSPFDDSVGAIGKIWAKMAVIYNDLDQIEIFSGVDSSRINEGAIEALKQNGLEIKKTKSGASLLYTVKFSESLPSLKISGKRVSHPDNPQSDFVALILNDHSTTPSSIFTGADFRLPIFYDPPQSQENKYSELSLRVGADMFYIFSEVRKSIAPR